MGKVRRRFSAEFKEQICQQIMSGTDVREICRDHQIHRQTVEGWLGKYQQGESLAKPTAKEKAQAREIEKLKAKVGEQAMTIDLLKKIQEDLRHRKKENGSVITGKNLAQFQKRAKS